MRRIIMGSVYMDTTAAEPSSHADLQILYSFQVAPPVARTWGRNHVLFTRFMVSVVWKLHLQSYIWLTSQQQHTT